MMKEVFLFIKLHQTMPNKKYRVTLSLDERTFLLEYLGRGQHPTRQQTRARVMLKADEAPHGPAWSDQRIAEALELSPGGVAAIRHRFCERGLRACLERKMPERQYERRLDGEAEAHLIRLACSQAPDGHAQWSLRLLADSIVELGLVDSISHETVRQTLKKTNFNPIAVGNG